MQSGGNCRGGIAEIKGFDDARILTRVWKGATRMSAEGSNWIVAHFYVGVY